MRILFLMLLGFAFRSLAQVDTNAPPPPNYAVKFHLNDGWTGPTNWPKIYAALGTNTTADSGWIVFTYTNFWNMLSTNQSAFSLWQSNQAYQSYVNVSSNYAAWSNMYVQIPQGITDSSNRFNTFTNMSAVMTSLRSSWQSGTNTASGTNVIISRLFTNMVLWAQQDQVGWTYLNQVIVYLSRLGPGLQQVYQPANDPVGH